ncbi:MAG TPA: hypothetical protein VML94_03250 [Thermoplasmata archaeon]|nr:hypothetical protein [Thermoplasmata archaeon]
MAPDGQSRAESRPNDSGRVLDLGRAHRSFLRRSRILRHAVLVGVVGLVALIGVGSTPGYSGPQAGFEQARLTELPSSGLGGRHQPPVWQLPFGVNMLTAGATYAAFVPGINFGPDHTPCAAPSESNGSDHPTTLVPGRIQLDCLNGVDDGIVTSAWQSNMTNFTTYQNGSSSIVGCAPTPHSGGCPFFASNRYTDYVSDWEGGAPANTSTIWEPSETGIHVNDVVFYLTVNFNASAAPGTLYAFTLYVVGATPAPVTYFLTTPATHWTGNASVTVVFDMDLAWFTQLNASGSLNSSGFPSDGIGVNAGPYRLAVKSLAPFPDFAVTFRESGLTGGRAWSVALGGALQNSTSSAMVFTLPNGTYPYMIVGPRDYPLEGPLGTPLAPIGNVTVHDANVTVGFEFVKGLTRTLSFHESGLIPGTRWCVSYGYLSSDCTTNPTMAFKQLTPWTYPYVVWSVSGYNESVSLRGGIVGSTGSANLTSRNQTLHVVFTPRLYSVEFVQSGLPTTAVWHVKAICDERERSKVGCYGMDAHEKARGTTLSLMLRNGSYGWKVTPIRGYELKVDGVVGWTGSLTVASAGPTVNLTFLRDPARPVGPFREAHPPASALPPEGAAEFLARTVTRSSPVAPGR